MIKRILKAGAAAVAAIAEAIDDDGRIDGEEAIAILFAALRALK
jgi:hypothetical protein